MKIILYNPHISDFIWKPLFYLINNRFASKKFSYLRDYIQENPEGFIFYIDKSSIPRQLGILSILFPKSIEIFLWCLINKINPIKIKKLYSAKSLNAYKDGVMFWFIFENLNYEWAELPKFEGIKIFHLNHYFANIKTVNENILKNRVDFLVAENNLYKNSDYFRKYVNYNKDVYVLPYTFQKRFVENTPFSLRKNICFSAGNYFIIPESGKTTYLKEYTNFFKTNTYHPIRKLIAENQKYIWMYIDCYNHLYNTWMKDGNNLLIKIYNNLRTYWNYKQFNIVEKYNEYKMFVAGEELCWLPPVAFMEWMACGSAYIGIDDNMYRDIGLIPWKHYIAYDGTLDNLIEKIRYYQEHSAELETIAQTGSDFVKKNLNWRVLAQKFFQDIERLRSLDKTLFISSFVNRG